MALPLTPTYVKLPTLSAHGVGETVGKNVVGLTEGKEVGARVSHFPQSALQLLATVVMEQ